MVSVGGILTYKTDVKNAQEHYEHGVKLQKNFL